MEYAARTNVKPAPPPAPAPPAIERMVEDPTAKFWRSKGFDLPDRKPGERLKIVDGPFGGIINVKWEQGPVEWHGAPARTYELKPRTPAYVWGIVAVVVLAALAWLFYRDFSGFYGVM